MLKIELSPGFEYHSLVYGSDLKIMGHLEVVNSPIKVNH